MDRNVFGLVMTLLVISTSAAAVRMSQAKEICLEETGIDSINLKNVYNRAAWYHRETQCFAACLYRELGFVDEKGSFNVDFFSTMIAGFYQGADKTAIADELTKCNSEVIYATELCKIIVTRMAYAIESPNIGKIFKKNR